MLLLTSRENLCYINVLCKAWGSFIGFSLQFSYFYNLVKIVSIDIVSILLYADNIVPLSDCFVKLLFWLFT